MKTTELLIAQPEIYTSLELERRLEWLDYLVTAIASNGVDALDFAERLRPDIALVDLDLEGELSGVETATMLAGDLNIPSIFLVNRSKIQDLTGAQLSEGLGYIIIDTASNSELHISIKLGLSVHQKHQEFLANLEWHRAQLDACMARIHTLQAEITSIKTPTLPQEARLALA